MLFGKGVNKGMILIMSSEKQSSCHECNDDEGINLLKYDQSIYYLCDDCYEEHMKDEE